MNKVVKTATLIAFAVALSVFGVKPAAAAFDLSKTIGKAKEKAKDDAIKSVTNTAIKEANKAITPKGPTKEIQITDIPSEYDGHYATVMAALPESSMDVCIPSYLTIGSDGTLIDTVKAGEVKVYTPCDDKKRLITIVFSKTKDKDTTSAAGFIYAKDAGKDVCKSKTAMPVYKLSEKQTFRFSDFISNESCKNIADAVKSKK